MTWQEVVITIWKDVFWAVVLIFSLTALNEIVEVWSRRKR